MNATPIKKSSSGKIRHLPEMTAASLPALTSTRGKGLRWGALILLLTCGLFFTMNGAGLAQSDRCDLSDIFAFKGTAHQRDTDNFPDRVTLTENVRRTAGAVMSRAKIDFNKPITIAFQAFLGFSDDGADGIAAVFHNSSFGSSAWGHHGSYLGAYYIHNGIALEIDTHNSSHEYWGSNWWKYGWRWEDHTSIWDTDVESRGGHIGGYLTSAIGHGNLEDRQWHDVVISWDPATATLSYTLDGANAGSYTHRRGKRDFLNTYFGGASMVHFGITAATGDLTNVQLINFADIDCSLLAPSVEDVFDFNGTAYQRRGYYTDRVILTENVGNSAGSIMSKGLVDFILKPFTIAFKAFLGFSDHGADGITAVFHNSPDGSGALGRPGGFLGAGGIQNGIALEIDTYRSPFENWGRNMGKYGWLWEDHTSIWDTDATPGGPPPFGQLSIAPGDGNWDYNWRLEDINDAITKGHSPVGHLTNAIGHGNLEDRRWHDVEISWDPATATLSYTLDGANAGSYTHNRGKWDFVRTYFGGARWVRFGITAATGGLTNVQLINLTDLDYGVLN